MLSKTKRVLLWILAISLVPLTLVAASTSAFAGPQRSFPGCPALSETRSTGSCVQRLQADLNTVHPEYRLTVDGQFGPATRTVVLDYQARNSLGADGIVGPVTADTLTRQVVAIQAERQATPRLTPFQSCQQRQPGSVSDGHGGCVADGASPLGQSVATCLTRAVGKDLARKIYTAYKSGGASAARKAIAKEAPGRVLAAAKIMKCILLD